MTPPSRPAVAPPETTPSLSHPRLRRAKRGVVAGYIHEISPRHRPASELDPGAAAPVAGPVVLVPAE